MTYVASFAANSKSKRIDLIQIKAQSLTRA
jgi:hypothetical protein